MAIGFLRRSIRGLDKDHNHDLKDIFKGAAMRASNAAGPLKVFYAVLCAVMRFQPQAAVGAIPIGDGVHTLHCRHREWPNCDTTP